MKLLLTSLILCLSLSTFGQKSLTVNDNAEDILSILDQFESINLDFSIPSPISEDLLFNNSNSRLSPGEMAIFSIKHSVSHPFSCLVKQKIDNVSKWVSQRLFSFAINIHQDDCLNQDRNNCFISFKDFQLKSDKDQIFILASTLIPCLLYTSPSPRDRTRSRMPSSA